MSRLWCGVVWCSAVWSKVCRTVCGMWCGMLWYGTFWLQHEKAMVDSKCYPSNMACHGAVLKQQQQKQQPTINKQSSNNDNSWDHKSSNNKTNTWVSQKRQTHVERPQDGGDKRLLRFTLEHPLRLQYAISEGLIWFGLVDSNVH